jgi:hypothetical protein
MKDEDIALWYRTQGRDFDGTARVLDVHRIAIAGLYVTDYLFVFVINKVCNKVGLWYFTEAFHQPSRLGMQGLVDRDQLFSVVADCIVAALNYMITRNNSLA